MRFDDGSRHPFGRFLFYGLAAVSLVLTLSVLLPHHDRIKDHATKFYNQSFNKKYEWDYYRDELRYGLTDEQCDIAFPKLWREIDRAKYYRRQTGKNVTIADLDRNGAQNGIVRAMIWEGKLYIIDVFDKIFRPGFTERVVATLHNLHRAVASAADPKGIPNIEFIMLMEDSTHFSFEELTLPSDRTLWTFARKTSDKNIWTIPEYGKWTELGAPEDIRRDMEEVEQTVIQGAAVNRKGMDIFDMKIPKLLWRGATWSNEAVRKGLLDVTNGKEWADTLEVGADTPIENFVPINEQCKWQFLAYTEGISSSGRLKYQHNCKSIIVSHELEYLTPFMAVLEPEGPEQNVVMVKRDWSDLPRAMTDLLKNPDKARMIANNNIKSMKERYMTGAAEACYWRRLFRSWREVSFEPNPWTVDEKGQRKMRGIAFETWTMPNRYTSNNTYSPGQ